MKFLIESDGNPMGSAVYLIEDDGEKRRLQNVIAYSVHARAHDVPQADIELASVGVNGEFVGDVIAVPAKVLDAAIAVTKEVFPDGPEEADVLQNLEDALTAAGLLS